MNDENFGLRDGRRREFPLRRREQSRDLENKPYRGSNVGPGGIEGSTRPPATPTTIYTFNVTHSRRVYRNARKTVDVKTVYQLSRRFDLFCDVSNIFAHPDREFESGGGRPQVLHQIEPQVFAGIDGRW